MKIQIKEVLKRQVFLGALKTKSFHATESYLIFGDARGGTTWLMELLGSISGAIMVEEPLHLRDGCLSEGLNFGWRQPIPKHAKWDAAKADFTAILSGRQISLSALRPNSLGNILKGNKLLFKFVRGNALLPWLCEYINFQFPPIYLLRHPVAVASSQIQNFPKSSRYRLFELPQHPYNEIYKRHLSFLQSLASRLQQLVALWCIHNQQALLEDNNAWLKIYYEDLLLQPDHTIKKICDSWGIPFFSNIQSKIHKPSYSDFQNDYRDNVKEQLMKWKNQVENEELEKIQAVLDYFGIIEYQAEELLPVNKS